MENGLPLWVAIVIAIGTPLLALAGAVLGQVLSRRGARELDVRWRREETMRILRWSAELAADPADPRSSLGVAALEALAESELLQEPDRSLVRIVLNAALAEPVANYNEGDSPREVD